MFNLYVDKHKAFKVCLIHITLYLSNAKLHFNHEKLDLTMSNVDTVEGVCNGFLALYTFFWFPEFSGYHQWQQESQ